jgi:hypothetical protein
MLFERHKWLVYMIICKSWRESDKAAQVATKLWAGLPKNRGSITWRLLFPVERPTQPPIHCVLWNFPSMWSGRDVDLTTRLHLQWKLMASGFSLSYAFMMCTWTNSPHCSSYRFDLPRFVSFYLTLPHFASFCLTSPQFTSFHPSLPYFTSLLISSETKLKKHLMVTESGLKLPIKSKSTQCQIYVERKRTDGEVILLFGVRIKCRILW